MPLRLKVEDKHTIMLHKYEIGVCLDEDVAYLLEEKFDENLITIIHADDEKKSNVKTRVKNHKQAFLKKIFDMIRDFDKVSLCGSAAVKSEIRKLFKDNSVKEVEIKECEGEQVTESQKVAFINHYFKAR